MGTARRAVLIEILVGSCGCLLWASADAGEAERATVEDVVL
jgi:hypothetical protein